MCCASARQCTPTICPYGDRVNAERLLDGLTLFCESSAETLVLAFIREERRSASVEGFGAEWSSIEVSFDDGVLRLTTKTRLQPRGARPFDEFSRIILGMLDWIRHSTQADDAKRQARERIRDCVLMVGINPVPPMSPGSDRFESCLRLAKALDAIAFDGTTLYDSDATVLMTRAS